MMRLSINELTTWRWQFDEDVARYAAEGIKAIGVSRGKLSDYGEEKGIELLRNAGLEVSNLLFVGGFTGCDGNTIADRVADAAAAIRLCAELGTRCLVVYTGGRTLHTFGHARRLVRDALRSLAPLAEEHGVSLALEPMRADCAADCSLLHTVDDALEMIAQVDSPSIKLALDTYHLGLDGNLENRLPEVAPHTAIVHVGDGRHPQDGEQDRCVLGEGEVPLAEIVRGLLAEGYDGHFDIELMGVDIERSDYFDVIRRSKQWFESLVSVGGAA